MLVISTEAERSNPDLLEITSETSKPEIPPQRWVRVGVVFETESPEAAEEFLQNDPFIKNDLMRAAVHPFRTSFTRE